jgi:lipid II:glycine glycyltransferase (peptidoglycan interpeptide bridge formation enzyme)
LVKRKIKLALSNGVEIYEVSDPSSLNAFSVLWEETWSRTGVRVDKTLIYRQAKAIHDHGLGKIYLAKYKNEIVAGRIVLLDFNYNMGVDFSAPSSVNGLRFGANYLLVHHVLTEAVKLGFSTFDFLGVECSPKMGSKENGIKMFKSQFIPKEERINVETPQYLKIISLKATFVMIIHGLIRKAIKT